MGVSREERGLLVLYIGAIKDMCEGIRTSVRTSVRDTKNFSIDIGPHQGSAFSPFLFSIILDELTKEI